jgi:hypothetical protein
MEATVSLRDTEKRRRKQAPARSFVAPFLCVIPFPPSAPLSTQVSFSLNGTSHERCVAYLAFPCRIPGFHMVSRNGGAANASRLGI